MSTMYLDKISAYAQSSNFIKPQPPADVKTLCATEDELNVKFPNELKELLSEMNGDSWLIFSAQQIVENNLQTRKALSECYAGLSEMLFIAGNGCGDYYAYIISDGQISTTRIVRWEHETNNRVIVAENLAEMIDRYYNDEI